MRSHSRRNSQDDNNSELPTIPAIDPKKKSIITKKFIASSLAMLALTASTVWYVAAKNGYIDSDVFGSSMNSTSVGPSKATTELKGITVSSNVHQPTAEDLRLPTIITPDQYYLKIKLYLPGYVQFPAEKNLTFEASLNVVMTAQQPTRKIVMNSVGLKIDDKSARVYTKATGIKIERIVFQTELEKIEILLSRDLSANETVNLLLPYSGKISGGLFGLYQTHYTDAAGNKKIAAATQMQAAEARKMVPCFDEPQFKAIWSIEVVHPMGTTAIANGIETDQFVDKGDFVCTTFLETPKMSSYLLALVVSDFKYTEGYTKSNIRFRVWARAEVANQTQYALEAGIKVIEFYEQLFGIDFPLKKQDMVALPDFSLGAMENWGLVTYRESSLLYNDVDYDLFNKKYIAKIIAHELAHQWFGNLVTLKWWDTLWLNEGFATLIENLGADFISDDEFHMKDFFLIQSLTNALKVDASAQSHPLSFRIDTSIQVMEAFSTITYHKGGSVLHMIRTVIGEDTFNAGIKKYLKRFQYGNTDASDLWTALDEVIPSDFPGPNGERLNISDFAAQWTTQLGHPVVTVKKVENGYSLSQKRYKSVENALEPEKYRYPTYKFKWDVPIWYNEHNGTVKLIWLNRNDEEVVVNTKSPYIVINVDSNAFIRTNYDVKGWEMIIDALEVWPETFSLRTRHALIVDAFAMTRVKKMDYDHLFLLIEAVNDEHEYFTLHAIVSNVNNLLGYLGDDEVGNSVREYFRKYLQESKKLISLIELTENYSEQDILLEIGFEQQLVSFLVSLGDGEMSEKMAEVFMKGFLSNCDGAQISSKCSKVTPPLRYVAYCAGVKMNGSYFDQLLEMYKREDDPTERNRLLSGLVCVQSEEKLLSLFDLTLNRKTNIIRLQDASTVFSYAVSIPLGRKILFAYFVSHWTQFYESLREDVWTVGRVIASCSSTLNTRKELEQLKSLITSDPHAKEFAAFNQAIEAAEAKLTWIEENKATVARIMKEKLA